MTTRVFSLDLKTGTRLAELELSNLKYGQRLNSAAPLTGSLKLPALDTAANLARARVLNDAVDENRRHLIVDRDGVIVGDGIVWASPDGREPDTRDITGSSFWSYWWHLFISSRQAFTATDQLTIARTILTYSLTKPGADVGLTIGTETCGVVRDRTYEAFELKEIGQAIEDLAAVDGGFDFGIDLSWDPSTGALVKRLNLHYPRRGRNYAATGHVFEVGRNVIGFEWPSDGTKTANRVIAVGGGEGASQLWTEARDAYQVQPLTSGGPGYPLLEDVLTNKDVTVLSTLLAQAKARVTARSVPVVLPKITVRADMDPILGSYITGDACRLIVPPGMSSRFPDGIDVFRRIMGWEVAVDDEGTEAVTLTIGEEPIA